MTRDFKTGYKTMYPSSQKARIRDGYSNIYMMVCEGLMNNSKNNLRLLLIGLKSKVVIKSSPLSQYHACLK